MRHNFPVLTPIQQQQNAVRQMNLLTPPCPCCQTPQSLYEAAGATTPPEMDAFDDTPAVRDLNCVSCQTHLQQSVVYAVGTTWVWEQR